MGLMNKLFGGGTKLEMKLDADRIPEGGMLSGSLNLHGGKKPLEVKALTVKLFYVQVTPVEGQPLPRIELKGLVDETLAANEALPPAALKKYNFTIPVPRGTDPKGKYRVVAAADIPGVADPTAEQDLTVTPAIERNFFGIAKGSAAIGADEILQRFPGLRASDEDTIASAVSDLQLATYEPDSNFLAAEPLLAKFIRQGTTRRLKEAALQAWGTILNNRARPEHIKSLEAIAAETDPNSRLMSSVVEVAAKFAEEGALPLVERLAAHPHPDVRASVATNLYLNADPKLKERKDLLLRLTRDPEAKVRENAYAAFASFAEDPTMVKLAFDALAKDGSPDVQRACVRAVSAAHWYGHKDSVFQAFLSKTRSPHPEVRTEIASSSSWLPADPRLEQIVSALLADPNVEVRKAMAWQSVNFGEHPELAGLFVRAATDDPALEVRADALEGLARVLPIGDAVALYRQRLAADLSEAVGLSVANGLRDQAGEPIARQLLTELTRNSYSRVADRAREILAG